MEQLRGRHLLVIIVAGFIATVALHKIRQQKIHGVRGKLNRPQRQGMTDRLNATFVYNSI